MKKNENGELNIAMRYWGYYAALEYDLKRISRFVNFSDENKETHSIEFTRLILSSCSEVEVVLKQICCILNEDSKPKTILDYQRIIKNELPELLFEKVNIGFHFFGLQPWESWINDETPSWWKKYNGIKHERNKYFDEANLDNAVKSLGALFICVNYYYKVLFSRLSGNLKKEEIGFKEITSLLKTNTNFIKFQADYYIQHLRVN